MVSYDHPIMWEKLVSTNKKCQISEYGRFFKPTISLFKRDTTKKIIVIRQLFIHNHTFLCTLMNIGSLYVLEKKREKNLPRWFCWWTRFGNHCLETQNLELILDPLFAMELYKDQGCLSLGLAFSKTICSNLCQILCHLYVHGTAFSFMALRFARGKLNYFSNYQRVCLL